MMRNEGGKECGGLPWVALGDSYLPNTRTIGAVAWKQGP